MLKLLAIRICLGFALGALAVFIVEVATIGLTVIRYGSLDEFLQRKHTHEEMLAVSLVISIMVGAACSTMSASMFAVPLAPFASTRRAVIRSWLMAAILGMITGAAIGAYFGREDFADGAAYQAGMLSSAILGAISGLIGSVILRCTLNR